MAEQILIHVRVTAEQQASLQRIAKQKDRSVAWVVRSLIDRLTEG